MIVHLRRGDRKRQYILACIGGVQKPPPPPYHDDSSFVFSTITCEKDFNRRTDGKHCRAQMDAKKIHQNPSDVKFPTLWLLAARKVNAEECEYIIERNNVQNKVSSCVWRRKWNLKFLWVFCLVVHVLNLTSNNCSTVRIYDFHNLFYSICDVFPKYLLSKYKYDVDKNIKIFHPDCWKRHYELHFKFFFSLRIICIIHVCWVFYVCWKFNTSIFYQ